MVVVARIDTLLCRYTCVHYITHASGVDKKMKKVLRRTGTAVLAIALLFIASDYTFMYGARYGYELGWQDGMYTMYHRLVKPT